MPEPGKLRKAAGWFLVDVGIVVLDRRLPARPPPQDRRGAAPAGTISVTTATTIRPETTTYQ